MVTATGNIIGGNIRTAGVITATGNITGNYFIGNGSQLSNVNVSTISNGNSNVLIASSAGNVSINVNGVSPVALFTPLGVVVEGNVSATGNVLAPAIVGGTITGSSTSVTGNVTAGNLISNGNIATLSAVKRVILVANTAPSGSDGAVGDIWYQTY